MKPLLQDEAMRTWIVQASSHRFRMARLGAHCNGSSEGLWAFAATPAQLRARPTDA
jgi:hypothetical protein